MAIQYEVDLILHHIKSMAGTLEHNSRMLSILEGDLMRFVNEHLAKELREQSLKDALPRVAPINFFKRIIDKLSKIYQQSVQRRIVDGTERDAELLEMYEESMQMNCNMNIGNEYFNAFKTNLNQLFLSGKPLEGLGRPDIRPITNDLFYVWSNDPVDPTKPTHIILPRGKKTKTMPIGVGDKEVDWFKVYTETEEMFIDSDGDVFPGNDMGGVNPFGLDTFMYVNRSKVFLNPPIDSDSYQMSVLLPALISDLNFAVKYASYSIVWGVDVDDENLTRSPNAFWSLKSDATKDSKPQVGQIKPQVDIQAAMQLIISQLSMWLNSRNIRPGSVSDVSAENMVSGISKLVDEMDTSDERKKQVERYQAAEQHFWNGADGMSGVLHRIHPAWVRSGEIVPNMRYTFSPNCFVEISFPEQLPMIRRGQLVQDLIAEMNAGFISRETAMAKLNPEWSEERIAEEIEAIDGDSEVEVEDDTLANDDLNQDDVSNSNDEEPVGDSNGLAEN